MERKGKRPEDYDLSTFRDLTTFGDVSTYMGPQQPPPRMGWFRSVRLRIENADPFTLALISMALSWVALGMAIANLVNQ